MRKILPAVNAVWAHPPARSTANAVAAESLLSGPVPAWIRSSSLLLCLVPIAVIVYLIYVWAVPAPFWDAWDVAPIILAGHNHTLTLSLIWAQHNEHRMLFPNLVMLGLAHFGGWDVVSECWCSLILAIATFGLIVLVIRRTVRSRVKYGLAVALSFVFFNPVQWCTFVFGFQLQWPITVLAVVVALWALTFQSGRWAGFAVAVVAAFVASYSLASGLMIWIVGAAAMFHAGERPWTNSQRIAWIICAVICIAVFFIGYIFPDRHPVNALQWCAYILYGLGSLWAYNDCGADFLIAGGGASRLSTMVAGGASVVALAAYLIAWIRLRPRLEAADRTRLLPWMLMLGFGLLSEAANAFGRSYLGAEQAGSSRYITVSDLFVLGLTGASVTLWSLFRRHGDRISRIASAVSIGLPAVCLYLLFMSSKTSFLATEDFERPLLPVMANLMHFEQMPDADLSRICTDPVTLRYRLTQLKEANLLVISSR